MKVRTQPLPMKKVAEDVDCATFSGVLDESLNSQCGVPLLLGAVHICDRFGPRERPKVSRGEP
jgi:hypothetical protein